MRVLLCAALVLAACGRSDQAPAPASSQPKAVPPSAASGPPTGSVASGSTGAGPSKAASTATDPGPVYQHASGQREVLRGEPVTLPGRVTVTDGHAYVVADVPAGTFAASGAGGDPALTGGRLFVDGPTRGAAALGRDGDFGAAVRRVGVRLVTDQAPDRVVLQGYLPETGDGHGAFTARAVTLSPLTPASDPAEVRRTFFRDLAADLTGLGDQGWFDGARPFYAFAAARARLMAGDAGAAAGEPRPTRRGELADMMRLYTGVTSVDEALQADRGLRLRGDPAAARTVPLADVPGVALAPHPWEQIIAGLGQPVVEPMAAAIPDGLLYAHFHDLRTAVKLMADVDQWLTPFAQAAEGRAGTTHLTERYERQLMIERLGLAERLGRLAASGFALVAGDPFFREGTDVALVFQVRQRPLLVGALETYEARARATRPDATETTYTLAGRTVRRVATADRAIDQHRLELGDRLVLANSRAMVERFVDVADGQAPSLAAAGDFRAMRASYPFAPESEDGFLFIGDRFVADAVSPRTKILQARRVDAAADLAAVGYAALLYGWLEGRPAAGADALVAAGLLDRSELKHADGTPITLDPATGPRSTTWGRPAALTPLAELTLDRVTPAERDAYAAFRDSYQSYWRTFIDPIAVRLVRGQDGRSLTADARMLPLIAQSDYDELVDTVGKARVRPARLDAEGPAGAGLEWTLAIGEDARLRRELDRIGGLMGARDVGFGWLGRWVALGAADRAGLWDLALATGAVPELRDDRRRFDEDDPNTWRALSRLPIHVAAEVGNPLALASTLTALRAMASGAAPGLIDWGEVGKHRDVPIVGIQAAKTASDLPPGAADVVLHYATAKNVWVAALDRPTLEQQIDRVLDGQATRRVETGDADAPQAALQVAPRAGGYLGRVLLGLAEASLRRGLHAALRDTEALARGLGGLPTDPAARRAAALGYLGYEPMLAQGGEFAMDPRGFATHARYGSEIAPAYPPVPVPDAPLTRLVDALARVSAGLAFEGEGDTRGLRVWFEWLRR